MIEDACGGAAEWFAPPARGPLPASDSEDDNVPLDVVARALASQVDSDDSDDLPLDVVARRGIAQSARL